MVEPFEQKIGITSVLSGYTGGNIPHPTYDQVSSGLSGHVEAVEIIFDNRLITYEGLVSLYWQLTDPTDAGGQFQDRESSTDQSFLSEIRSNKRLLKRQKNSCKGQVIMQNQSSQRLDQPRLSGQPRITIKGFTKKSSSVSPDSTCPQTIAGLSAD